MPITVAAYTPSIAPGPYQATCTGLTEKATKDGNTFRVWEFTLDDGRSTSGASSLSTSPKSKGGKWLTALIGRQAEAGETVEPVGRRCTIIIELDDNGYERVTTVAPPEAAPRRQTRTATAEAIADSEGTAKATTIHAVQEDELPL